MGEEDREERKRNLSAVWAGQCVGVTGIISDHESRATPTHTDLHDLSFSPLLFPFSFFLWHTHTNGEHGGRVALFTISGVDPVVIRVHDSHTRYCTGEALAVDYIWPLLKRFIL